LFKTELRVIDNEVNVQKIFVEAQLFNKFIF